VDTVPLDTSKFHPKARQLFAYWLRAHPPDRLPGRQHVSPQDIAELLPNLALVEVHDTPARFRYRLLGSCLDAHSGRSLVGQWLDAAHAESAGSLELLADYRMVVATRNPCWRRGAPRVASQLGCGLVEVLRLPLAADGSTIDMILGLTLYFDARGRETPGSVLGPL
jgi:hypothetical protein